MSKVKIIKTAITPAKGFDAGALLQDIGATRAQWEGGTFKFAHHDSACAGYHLVYNAESFKKIAKLLEDYEKTYCPANTIGLELGLLVNFNPLYVACKGSRYQTLEEISKENEKKRKKLQTMEKNLKKAQARIELLRNELKAPEEDA